MGRSAPSETPPTWAPAEGHSHVHQQASDHATEHRHDHDPVQHARDVTTPLTVDDWVVQLETNVDNMNPEWYGHLSDRLFAQGALDVTLAPVLMKKGRPGTLVSVLVRPEDTERALDMLFSESTTLGVRIGELARRTLPRHTEPVETPFGTVHVKYAVHRGAVRSAAPEYDDCRTAALRHGVPLREVYEAALAASQHR
ncbi:MAG TPA: nickel insertion protein, partial [Chloroflexota bacterium]|nr:nickel insertion protein [Chloroflexota bacterium]